LLWRGSWFLTFELTGDYGSSTNGEGITIFGEDGTNLGFYNRDDSDNVAYEDCGVVAMNISFTITQAQWNSWNNDGDVDLTFSASNDVNFCTTNYSCVGDVTASYLGNGYSNQDTDGDGIQDHVDLDSDNDGCEDAIEGAANFTTDNTDANGELTGAVDANGVPIIASGGQATLSDVINAGNSSQCGGSCPPTVRINRHTIRKVTN